MCLNFVYKRQAGNTRIWNKLTLHKFTPLLGTTTIVMGREATTVVVNQKHTGQTGFNVKKPKKADGLH